MSETPDVKSTPIPKTRRRRRWLIGAAVVVSLLATALTVVVVNRIPIAEKMMRDRFASMGLVDSRFTIEALTPRQVKVSGLALDAGGTVALRSVTMDLTWPSWTAPRIAQIRIDGLRLRLGLKDGRLDAGPLASLIDGKGPAQGEQTIAIPILPPLRIKDALVEVDGLGGTLILAVPEATLSATRESGNALNFADVDVIHPAGQATLSGDANVAANGALKATLRIADGEGSWSGGGLARAAGTVRISGLMTDLKNAQVDADIRLSGLTGPQGIRADGTIIGSVLRGVGKTEIHLTDAGHQADAKVTAAFDLTNAGMPSRVQAEIRLTDLTKLGLPVDVAGIGSAEITAQGKVQDVLVNGTDAIKDIFLTIKGNNLRSPRLPGTWAFDTDLIISINKGLAELRTAKPVNFEGDLWQGGLKGHMEGGATVDIAKPGASQFNLSDLSVQVRSLLLPQGHVLPEATAKLSASGRLDNLTGHLSVTAELGSNGLQGSASMDGGFKVMDRVLTYRPAGCNRVRVKSVTTGDFEVHGPLALCLTAKNDHDLLRVDLSDAAGPRTVVAADIRTETPAMTVKLKDGLTAVLRTGKVAGSITAKTKPQAHPAVAIDFAGLDGAISALDMDFENLGIDVQARGGPDPGWNFKYGLGAVTHVAFAPLAINGVGRWQPDNASVDGTLRQNRSGLIASFSAQNDNKTKAGRARIDSLPLDLARVDGGVHAITPFLKPFVAALTGTLQVSVAADWTAKGVAPAKVAASLNNAGITPARSLLPPDFSGLVAGLGRLRLEALIPPGSPTGGQATLALTGGNASWNKARVTGISAGVSLSPLWPPASPPAQEIKIERIDWGLPITDTTIRFRLLNTGSVHLEQALVKGAGGRISVSDLTLGGGAFPDRIVVEIEDLGLADIAQVFNVVGLEADGRISGRLPIELKADGAVAIRDGILQAIQAGTLSFKPPTRAQMAAGSSHMAMVLDILENLSFDDLSIIVNGDARKDVNLSLRIKGRNPKVQGGRPVDLTINLSGNIGQAIEAELQNFDIQGLVKGAKGPIPSGR